MKKLVLSAILLSCSCLSVAAEIDFRLGSLSHSKNSDFKSGVAYMGMSHLVNDYFSLRAYYGLGTNEHVSGSEVDTFIKSLDDTSLRSVEYSSNMMVDHIYGFDLNGHLPLSESVSIVASVGYQFAEWQERDFLDFEDNMPSSDPISSFQNGDSDCVITGIESFCGVQVQQFVDDFEESGMSYSAGLHWKTSLNSKVMVTYRKTHFDVLDFSSVDVGLSVKF